MEEEAKKAIINKILEESKDETKEKQKEEIPKELKDFIEAEKAKIVSKYDSEWPSVERKNNSK